MSGTTRSSDWRLRSTIHSTSPRRGDDRVDERLPDRALVELGVADQRDLAPALRHVEVAGDVAVRERAPDRRGRADADRAGREVDGVGVLGAARVALQAAELAQRRQVASVEAAEQVVDRVQDRRGVRLDRDAVGRAQVREVQRRHDADHRRRRGLVAADLHARRRLRAPCWRGGRCVVASHSTRLLRRASRTSSDGPSEAAGGMSVLVTPAAWHARGSGGPRGRGCCGGGAGRARTRRRRSPA